MTILTHGAEVVQVWTDGLSDFVGLYVLRGVTTGDTIDMTIHFRSVKRAVLLGVTVAGTVAASNVANVITIPSGVSNDAAYLLVYGVHA